MYHKTNWNNAAYVEVNCEAVSRLIVRFVGIKNPCLHKIRTPPEVLSGGVPQKALSVPRGNTECIWMAGSMTTTRNAPLGLRCAADLNRRTRRSRTRKLTNSIDPTIRHLKNGSPTDQVKTSTCYRGAVADSSIAFTIKSMGKWVTVTPGSPAEAIFTEVCRN